MTTFAKLFEHEKYGQILVTRENNDEGDPSVAVAILAPSPLDVCKISVSFTDDDTGHDKRDKMFEAVSATDAERFVAQGIWPAVERFLGEEGAEDE